MLRNVMIAGCLFLALSASGLMGGPFTEISSGGGQPQQAGSAPANATSANPMAPRPVKKNVIAYATQDPGMNAAKAKARATLPRFLRLIEAGMDGTYAVKYPLTQGGATEHIWVRVWKMKDGKFAGVLSNQPVNAGPLKMGDKVEVARAEIEDWMISTRSEIYGGYTARYAMKDLPKEEAAKYEAMFRD